MAAGFMTELYLSRSQTLFLKMNKSNRGIKETSYLFKIVSEEIEET